MLLENSVPLCTGRLKDWGQLVIFFITTKEIYLVVGMWTGRLEHLRTRTFRFILDHHQIQKNILKLLYKQIDYQPIIIPA